MVERGLDRRLVELAETGVNMLERIQAWVHRFGNDTSGGSEEAPHIRHQHQGEVAKQELSHDSPLGFGPAG